MLEWDTHSIGGGTEGTSELVYIYFILSVKRPDFFFVELSGPLTPSTKDFWLLISELKLYIIQLLSLNGGRLSKFLLLYLLARD